MANDDFGLLGYQSQCWYEACRGSDCRHKSDLRRRSKRSFDDPRDSGLIAGSLGANIQSVTQLVGGLT